MPNRSHKIQITPLRSKLLINGNETVEWDYGSIHPSILYHKFMGIDYEGDLYDGEEYDRKIVKYSLLTILNCKDEDGTKNITIRGVRKKLFDEGCKPKGGLTDDYLIKLIKYIENEYPLLKP